MKTKRLVIYSVVALTGATTGLVLAWAIHSADTPDTVRMTLERPPDHAPERARSPAKPPAATNQIGRLDLAGPQPRQKPAANPKKPVPDKPTGQAADKPRAQLPLWVLLENPTRAYAVPLNLNLPEPDTPVDDTAHDTRQLHPLDADAGMPSDLALSMAPQTLAAPQVKPDNLFKREYGLRGFMGQSWVNQRFAVQGGLGLNNDERAPTDTGFRDDIAVGMGVLVAF